MFWILQYFTTKLHYFSHNSKQSTPYNICISKKSCTLARERRKKQQAEQTSSQTTLKKNAPPQTHLCHTDSIKCSDSLICPAGRPQEHERTRLPPCKQTLHRNPFRVADDPQGHPHRPRRHRLSRQIHQSAPRRQDIPQFFIFVASTSEQAHDPEFLGRHGLA